MSFFSADNRKKLRQFFKNCAYLLKAESTPEEKRQDAIHLACDDDGPRMDLTAGEAALASSVFGPELLAESYVSKHYSAGFPGSPLGVASGTVVHFLGRAAHHDDYSLAPPDMFGTFMHEMTHVWQFVTGYEFTPHLHRTYMHVLEEGKTFADYGLEQQPTLIQNYVRRFLHKDHANSTHVTWADTPETDRLLQKIVEDQFPAAKQTRLALNLDPAILARAYGEAPTAEEKNLIAAFFGDGIQTDSMRKYYADNPNTAFIESGSQAYLRLPWNKADAPNDHLTAIGLLTAATMLWENQQGRAAAILAPQTGKTDLKTASFDDLEYLEKPRVVSEYLQSSARADVIRLVEGKFKGAAALRARFVDAPAARSPKSGPSV